MASDDCLRFIIIVVIDYSGDREAPTTLPQDPKADKAARLKQLEERREDYRWSTKVIGII